MHRASITLFISHAWKYSRAYRTVVKWLDSTPGLLWKNTSLPSHDGIEGDDVVRLRAAITQQIVEADLVLIIAGMYTAHSEWIAYEVAEAQRLGKPIIAIAPRGQKRLPSEIVEAAECVVRWRREQVGEVVLERVR
ncbi:MAG: TIR domain-containing protein [Rhodothermaceae bacterium]|nr:TIR domain-containing protein [Rhodothermaceae bacterium]